MTRKIQKTEDQEAAERIAAMITRNHSGKMTGLQSVSTSIIMNELCQKRQQCESLICHDCYAQALIDFRQSLDQKTRRNHEILTTTLIPWEQLPIIDSAFFRFESFADLCTDIQALNYYNMSRKNPDVRTALFTKNPWILRRMQRKFHTGKPANQNNVYSINKVNIPEEELQRMVQYIKRDFPGIITHVFAVYTKEYAAEHGIVINCGSRACRPCGTCYREPKNDDIIIVRELKK